MTRRTGNKTKPKIGLKIALFTYWIIDNEHLGKGKEGLTKLLFSIINYLEHRILEAEAPRGVYLKATPGIGKSIISEKLTQAINNPIKI